MKSKKKKLPEVSTVKVWDLDAVLAYIYGDDKKAISAFHDELSESDITTNGDVQSTVVYFDTLCCVGDNLQKDFRDRTEVKLLGTVSEARSIQVRL